MSARRPSGVRSPRIQQEPLVPSLACRGQPKQRDAACGLRSMFGGSSTGGALCLELKGSGDFREEGVFPMYATLI